MPGGTDTRGRIVAGLRRFDAAIKPSISIATRHGNNWLGSGIPVWVKWPSLTTANLRTTGKCSSVVDRAGTQLHDRLKLECQFNVPRCRIRGVPSSLRV